MDTAAEKVQNWVILTKIRFRTFWAIKTQILGREGSIFEQEKQEKQEKQDSKNFLAFLAFPVTFFDAQNGDTSAR